MPPSAVGTADSTVQQAYVYSQGLGFLSGLVATMLCVLQSTQLTMYPDKLKFLSTLDGLVDMPAVFVIISSLSMMAALAVTIYAVRQEGRQACAT